ncbi:MAG: guanylate kinase [Lachnospiraceae bacterium]|nr:guanylate kinase [Lachnospiraceae bacterium]MCD7766815.1 guanylate kinase [Lachnospiraceae bacterium]
MERKGILIVVSGYSGVGKGTLMKALTARYDTYALSISATTREPREGEQDGREYFFRTKDEFEELIAKDRLIEYASYCGNYYGTPKDYVEEQLKQGRDVILEIEQQGALKVKAKMPDVLMLFVMPPDAETLVQRLRGRETESEDVIRERLTQAVEESKYVDRYDYMIVNEDLDRAVEELHHLIESQHNRISRNLDFAKQIQQELMDLT